MEYNIVFICDDNFALPTGVAIYSLLVNKDGKSNYNICILGNGLSEDNKNRLLTLNKGNSFKVRLLDILDNPKYAGLNNIPGSHVNISALYKFDLPNIFSDLDKILYLDGDVIIKKDLASLFATDISDVYAAVVADRHGYFYKNQNFRDRLGFDNDGYFNTGVMLLNLHKMRQDNIPEQLLEYRKTGKNDFMDQDAFNVVIGKKVIYLPFLYNVISTCFRYSDIEHLNLFYPQAKQKSMEDVFKNCYIYHYASASVDKPWKSTNCMYGNEWEKYYSDSPFKDVVLDRIYANKAREERYEQLKKIIGENSENVKVSIIIPVYNAEKYLQQCLDSICKQRIIEELEVICIDDGSTDNSSFVINKYALSDPRIKMLYQENQGPGVARNKGISLAAAERITFIDADDMLASGYALKEAYEMSLEDKVDIIMCSGREFSEAGMLGRCNWLCERKYLPDQKYFSPSLLKDNIYLAFGGPCAKVYRKYFLINNNIKFPPFPRSEDFFFIQMAVTLADRIGVLDKELIYRRVETGSNLEATKDKTPIMFWDADKYFHEQLSAIKSEEFYKTSAKIRSLIRMDYNLGAMKTYDGYKQVYETAKKTIYPYLCQDNKIMESEELGGRKNRLENFINSNSDAEYIFKLFLEEKNNRVRLTNTLGVENRFIQRGKAQLSARIDVKLFGDTADFELQNISDNKAMIAIPGWFQNGGKGYHIETLSEDLNLSFIVKTDGKLTIYLRGKDVHGDDGKRLPYWINYNMLTYNGTTEFKEAKYAWHDKPITISREVKAGETVNLHIEWKPCKMQDPELPKRLKDTEKKLKASLSREASLKKSVSFRTGRALTWFPRKVRGGVRCLKEHGPAYTVKRFFWHITH